MIFIFYDIVPPRLVAISAIVGVGGVICYVAAQSAVVNHVKTVEDAGCVGAVFDNLVQDLVPLGKQCAVGFEGVDILLHVIQTLKVEIIGLYVFFSDERVGRCKYLSCDACEAVKALCGNERHGACAA